jgi:glycerol-1-phosphate dehydrogenase [NAD(P)+]
VERYYFRDFLGRFDAMGSLSCSCGRTHRILTRHVLIGQEAFEQSAALLEQLYGTRPRIWVLSDESTERAAGARWKHSMRAAVAGQVLPGTPKPVPSAELVEALALDARGASPDLLVAVGSGVISDLVKRMSLALGLPNWCVATAASVDAYSSATSAIRVDGFHGAVPARVSETIVCELRVIAGAPREMFFAGLGDLLAKFLAYLDWNLARIVTGEDYCALIANTALESARGALASARLFRDDPGEAVRTLTDAALCSGFTMQALGSSRSAASAEHVIAHFWETSNAARVERLALHGILVGVASRLVLDGYGALYERLERGGIDDRQRLDAFDREPPWQGMVEEGLDAYRGKVEEVMASRPFDRGILAQRLEAARTGMTEVLQLARPLLRELAGAVELLEGLGFPFAPGELGMEPEQVMLPLRSVRLLRQRYTGFDLAYELGLKWILRGERPRYPATGC